MDEPITLIIEGKPVGKGRPRFTRSGHSFTPEATRKYEAAVQAEYKATYGEYTFPDDVPVSMKIMAYYPIPSYGSKAIRAAKEKNIILPHNIKPDIDNVVKIICDALNGLAYKDDTQITALKAYKYYSNCPRVEVYLFEVKT